MADYSPLIEKIRNRISSWNNRFLSFAGRLQLVGSVIHSLTNFWISAFRLPKKCIQEIYSLCAAFLWSGTELNAKKAKVSWKDCCMPKEGGLGLKSVAEANKVASLKLFWRLVSSPSSLWVKWVKNYLIRKGSIWTVKESSTLGSWIWKKLLKHRDVVKEFLKTEIRNGEETSFWFDVWTPAGRLFDITGRRGCIDMGIRLDATVDMVIKTHRRRRHRVETLNDIRSYSATERERSPGRGRC